MPSAASNTPYGIIRDAMFDAGKLGEGEEPDSEQLATNMRRLSDVVNYFQTQGLKLFLQIETSLTLIAGTNTYVMPAISSTYPFKPLRILQGRIQTPEGNTRPIIALSWDEWNRLPQLNEGPVTGYLADKQATQLVVKLWNTPDTAEALNTAIFLVESQAPNPFNLEVNMSFPQEWRMALRWSLADEISTGQPSAIMERCQAKAAFYRTELENWDVEDAPTSFAPDYRGYYMTGGFR